jgi:hypothetical protein
MATQLERLIEQLKARELRAIRALLDESLTEHYGGFGASLRRPLTRSAV